MGSQRVNFHSLTYCYELCLFIAVKAFCPEIDFEIFVLFCFYLSFSFKPLRTLMRTNMYLYPNWYLLCVFYLPYLIVCMCSVTRPCPMLCDAMDCSLPDSSAHGILQARILEWIAISSSRGSPKLRGWIHVFSVSCIGRSPLSHLGKPYLILTIVLSFLFLDKGWVLSDFPFYSFEGYDLLLCIPKCLTCLAIIAFFK